MKKSLSVLSVFLMMLFLSVFTSCEKPDPPDPGLNPFSNGGNERNMIVIVSDMHLGTDTSYAQCISNREPLVKLLQYIKAAPNVRELVIAGDLADEWYVPATIDTYQGKNQADFVERLATENKGVFDALNSIIQEGKIRVSYVPGNHDIAITEESIELILPGINQARDNVLGLGTYTPVDCPKIAIEHGHRNNFNCSPDPFSNQDIAPGTILPPGYFLTRLAALSAAQKYPPPVDTLPTVTPNISGGESQEMLFKYWAIWEESMRLFPNTYKFDEKIIVTNLNEFTGNFSVNDLVPFQSVQGGAIDVSVYNNIQDQWEERQTYNHVPVHITAMQAIDSVMSNTFIDSQANLQYFLNPDSDKRIVVFGHTHIAKIVESVNNEGEKCIYANSGTWIDQNQGQTTMNFVVITPQSTDPSSQTQVILYNFEDEVVTKMAVDSLRY
jgi:UDP-2,3-diacylglucosamine pyrophosphatase LpxH